LGLGLAALAPAAPALKAGNLLAPGNPRRTPIVEVVEKVKDAVVNIHSERTIAPVNADDVFTLSAPGRVNGMGTGIALDPRGYIITNQHVVDDVQVIRIRLSDGSTYPARVVARDHENDLALLKIEPKKPLATLPIGTAGDLMIGETVLAVGNAYGYEHTVTQGIVSALKRDVTLNKDMAYKSLIQTDTAINPGNSGGPLVNLYGELVGVNVAIRAGAQNIAFAIPADTMLRVAADMLSVRKRNGLTHGLKLTDRVEPGSSPAVRSVAVELVEPAGPGISGGFQRGDVIVRVGDQRVATSLDVERALLDRAAGDKVQVAVQRDGSERYLELVLQALDRGPLASGDLVWRKLGLRLQQARAEAVTRVNSDLHGGLVVADVLPDGLAGRAGIQKGDILIGLHLWEMVTIENVNYVLTHPELSNFLPLQFHIIRDSRIRQGLLRQIN
jgi:serine protease Do